LRPRIVLPVLPLLLLALASGSPGQTAGTPAEGANTVAVDLSGLWVLNRELSDDARQKMREGMEGRRGPGDARMGGPGGGGMRGPGGDMGGRSGGPMGPPPGGMGRDDARESMRAILEPAEELAVTQSGNEIVIDERDGRTRRLHPNGKKYKTDNGNSEIKTSWKDGKLLVETKGRQGGGVLETWELVPDRSRIIVMVKVEGGFGQGIPLKRIYDRARESQPG
jgi:hypothetical protein